MEMEKRKPHDCECLMIVRTQSTGAPDEDNVIVNLVKAPYQPQNVNRVRIALIRQEDSKGYLTYDDVWQIVREHIEWSKGKDFFTCSRWICIPTPDGYSDYVREWVFADTVEDLDEYLLRTGNPNE